MPSSLMAGDLPATERWSNVPRHLLALTGGGYRGLFTAQIIARMEAQTKIGIAGHFDMMAGTSIGGIVAIGLACGIGAKDLVASISSRGPEIFKPRRRSVGGFVSARYDSNSLQKAIVGILGKDHAKRPFAEIPAPLLVVSVDDRMSEPRIFRTELCAPGEADDISTLDVAMATSAAPTYFAPHRIGERTYVDGGLIANAPDLVLLGEAMRRFDAELSDLHLCSIGTAGNPRTGNTSGQPGKIGWMARHELMELVMDAQAALTAEQVARLAPSSVLRMDKRPSRRIDLDDVRAETTDELLGLADQTVTEVTAARATLWRRFLGHRPAPL